MTDSELWTLAAADGELMLHTGVTGSAARMGHRLTIAMTSWQATVRWEGDAPVEVQLIVDIGSLAVVRGEGGMMPLSGPEKTVVRANALKSLRAGKYPQARFRATEIERHANSFRLTGTLELLGRSREQIVEVRVEDAGETWRISGAADVRHTDYGIKQFSMLMGAMKVADEVHVVFTAAHE